MIEPTSPGPEPPRLGRATLPAVALGYLAALVAATWPYAKGFATDLPSLTDPLVHLWTMRWYRLCLAEGRWPFHAPGIQYPSGAELGSVPPMHLQALLYLPLSMFSDNDALLYNIIWATGFVTTGLATFLLAWHATRDRAAAALAGLVAMLGAPMLAHGHAHLELIFLGGFPLFLLAWLRFVDRPSRGRLALAVGAYWLAAMCAHYYVVLVVIPAAWYASWSLATAGAGHRREWLAARWRPLGLFAAIALPGLALLFSSQIAASLGGLSVVRSGAEFDRYGAPWWSYLAPTGAHALSAVLPFDPQARAGTVGEQSSYLGIVTLLLLHRAWFRGQAATRAGYWWSLLAILVVLSLGASIRLGDLEVSMPAAWLRSWWLPFRLIRVPARFNMLATVVAGVLAAGALAGWRRSIARPAARAALTAAIFALALVDLANLPFAGERLPAVPAAYRWLVARDPDARIVDAPQSSTGSPNQPNAEAAYWQILHGARTTAGYSAHRNAAQDNLAFWPSPFNEGLIDHPGFLDDPDHQPVDLLGSVRYVDYARLYLERHGLRYVVLRRSAGAPGSVDRLERLLATAVVYRDATHTILDGDRLPGPSGPVALCLDGWNHRTIWRDKFVTFAGREARLVAENPDPSRPLTFAFEARSARRPRRVRLLAGETELASWQVAPGGFQLYVSPPLRLPAGRTGLTLESDGEQALDDGAREQTGEALPVALIVGGLSFGPAAAPEARR